MSVNQSFFSIPLQINVEEAGSFRIGVVTAQWNSEVNEKIRAGCMNYLAGAGVKDQNIVHVSVPGAYELPVAAQLLLEHASVEAVICIGTIIQGETRHFEFISQAVTQEIASLGTSYKRPVLFGVLTTESLAQAYDRAGGKKGDKGAEVAYSAVSMIALSRSIRKTNRKVVGFNSELDQEKA